MENKGGKCGEFVWCGASVDGGGLENAGVCQEFNEGLDVAGDLFGGRDCD